VRIKYLVPFPLDETGMDIRRQQVPQEILGPNTVVECVPVRNSCTYVDGYYEALLMEMYLVEAGLRAEEEGYDAVIVDTFSDSGMYALRSRLNILVMGPGVAAYTIAMMLGKKFTILLTWDRWRYIDERNLETYGFGHRCASLRTLKKFDPDLRLLFSGREEEYYPQLLEEAKAAIDEDGADVIILGSTTMHQIGKFLSEELPVPVINAGPAAIKMTETLLELGFTHSKAAFPSPIVNHDEKWFSLMGVEAPAAAKAE
jgi:allantoin racemase